MKTSLFDFEFPASSIAVTPATPRDSARMLVVQGNALEDSSILHLADFLRAGDVVVFNNTKVIPARIRGMRGLAGIEVTLHKQLEANRWSAFAKPGKRLRAGDTITFADDFSAEVLSKHESGEVELLFTCVNLFACLERHGSMPLPPYMKRAATEHDKNAYQTIYAKHKGAVAAPTAGLHFTDRIFETLHAKGIIKTFVTLHVGGGTFLPVKSEDTTEHRMHSEYAEISGETAGIINRAKAAGGRIVAVGTTSLRVLETAVNEEGILKQFNGETDIFITPGYRFKAVDMLMTNFHLPRSTLFMLVSAFSGLDIMQNAYRHAIGTGYRFYSYGDAWLLSR